ncbi:MAG TPA: prepilin-type N-terminal cleavage/methylation domain-containing protein [bacterium]|nr:prepilin-type N-terminal cleavage/methylation domain-containing protein [bacterium]
MRKGFTIIELMIVLAIVAILAAVAIPLYGAYKERAVRAEAEEELLHVQTVEEDYFNSFRRYTITGKELRDFYGAKVLGEDPSPDNYGKNFMIELSGTTAAYVATAYVCYDKAGSACVSGVQNLTCTITADQEKPSCN